MLPGSESNAVAWLKLVEALVEFLLQRLAWLKLVEALVEFLLQRLVIGCQISMIAYPSLSSCEYVFSEEASE